jgi:class 3 adenylate cyclase/tetratricopeptide (TPR) repeat protein
MRCAKCGTDNRHAAKFCDKCGARLAPTCPSCGAENRPDARFCDSCGAALAPSSAATPQPSDYSQIRVVDPSNSENTDGERKTLTALFADIKGSMDLMEDLDPEEARALVDPALKLMIDAVRRYDGYIVQSTGDGIFALFGAPVAHEDHPQRALHAALRMQDEMRRYSAKLREAGNPPLEARVGINTGEAVVRSIKTGDAHTEYTPIGHSTSLASRMQTLAPTGSIAVTDATQKLCAGYFSFKSLGPTRVRGVSELINVFEVTGVGPLRTRLQRSAGRGLTKFVGRSREIDTMKHAAEQARAGHGQIVAAMAEAGVGKSRLFFEFKAISQSDWMVLETFSVSHGKASAYLPLIELLTNYFGIRSEDDERQRREKVAGRLAILDPSLEDTRPYIFALLGIVERLDPRQQWEQNLDRLDEYLRTMQDKDSLAQLDPRIQRRRTLDAIKRILLRESLNRPVIVIFEDLHWIDEATQEFLNLFADSLANARLLLLVNYRPEYQHQWNNKTYYTQLRLDPLGKESADEMLAALLGNGAEMAQLKRVIVERTEGNPFFMEETVQVLLDDGSLSRNGVIKLTRPLSELKIPPTVQAILASRIDRLPAEAKDLLQTLAVVGREFPISLIRAMVAKSDDDLDRLLNLLQLGEFIYEQPAVGDTEYAFKHALTQEVAYGSVLMERRRALHAQIGAAIETSYGIEDHLPELAHHYARSGNPYKAVEYCLKAVQQCAARASNAEAVAQFETGLEQLQKLPDDDGRAELELDLRNAAFDPLIIIKGYASHEAERSSARAIELCLRPGINWEKTWRALRGVFGLHLSRPDLRKACELGAELVARAEEQGRAELIVHALNGLALARNDSGDFESAAQDLDRGWALWESIGKPMTDLMQQRAGLMAHPAFNRIVSGWNLWFLGYPDRARKRIEVATSLAKESGSDSALETVHYFAAYIYELCRKPEHTRERVEAALVLANESGNVSGRDISGIYLGWVDAMAGDLGDGIARIRHHLSEMKASGSSLFEDRCLTLIVTALGQLGRYDEGLRAIDESFPFFQITRQRFYEAEVHRLKGELLLAQDASNGPRGEHSLRTAIEISRHQKAKSWELRATTSLARLMRDTNRRDEARSILADIYGWFTEGFDTADLKDAKAMLDELKAS